jgi:hypothetical protein
VQNLQKNIIDQISENYCLASYLDSCKHNSLGSFQLMGWLCKLVLCIDQWSSNPDLCTTCRI